MTSKKIVPIRKGSTKTTYFDSRTEDFLICLSMYINSRLLTGHYKIPKSIRGSKGDNFLSHSATIRHVFRGLQNDYSLIEKIFGFENMKEEFEELLALRHERSKEERSKK